MATENDKTTQQAAAAAEPADNEKKAKASSSKTKEALEKENAELLAKLKALEAAAAEKPKSAATPAADEDTASKAADDREEIYVPKGYANDEPFLIVGVNGINYQLPKGMTCTVPKFVADEFRRSQKAQTALDDRIEKMTSVSN